MDKSDRPSLLTERFNCSHTARLRSATVDSIFRTAYEDDYPTEVKPSAFYSRKTLLNVLRALRTDPCKTLVDLGCGHGGCSLWLAQQLGSNLIGIDLSDVGVKLAQERASQLNLGGRARFQEGDITATGLPESSCDAVMSLDVLVFVPNKEAAIGEIARILRPGGRLAFTTWEQSGYSQRLGAEQLSNYKPLLTSNGFQVETYEEPINWRHQQQKACEAIVASEMKLCLEMGLDDATRYVDMARGSLVDLPFRRYIFGAGRRL